MKQPTIQVEEITCPLCGTEPCSAIANIVDVTYGIPGDFRVVRCKGCRHIYLNPRPTLASILECYPTEYAPYQDEQTSGSEDLSSATVKLSDNLDKEYSSFGQVEEGRDSDDDNCKSRDRSWKTIPRAIMRWLWEENATLVPTPPRAGSRMLEVGCAHGGFLMKAERAGWQAEGVEPSNAAANVARRRGFSVHEGFLGDMSSPDREVYDWIAFWMVFEHVPNPREFLQQVHGLLRSDGVVTLSIPNAATWERWLFGRHWLGYDAPRHLQVFTAAKLRELLESEGFGQVRIVHQSNTRYWTGSLAAWGMQWFPKARWPKVWMEYFKNEPPVWSKWLLLIPGKINALLELSGRVTVEARKR